MAYPYIIIPDMEEGAEVTQNNIKVAYSENQVQDAIHKLSGQYPNVTLCIYRLHELRKIKTKPTYSEYKVNENFEIIPK